MGSTAPFDRHLLKFKDLLTIYLLIIVLDINKGVPKKVLTEVLMNHNTYL